jgi:hypothetical protein
MEVRMPRLRNYQDEPVNDFGKVLTEKQVRVLRKFGGIAGRRLINDVSRNPKHKHRDFVLWLWSAWRNNTHRQSRVFKELLCDVPPGTYASYYLSQGEQQKRTFRTNRFDSNMDYLQSTLKYGEWEDLPIVWRVETDLALPTEDETYRYSSIPTMTSYVVAGSAAEAASVWSMMVLVPCGLAKGNETNDYIRAASPRFCGPKVFFNTTKMNSEGKQEVEEKLAKEIERHESKLKELRDTRDRSQMVFALASSTILMSNAGESIAS